MLSICIPIYNFDVSLLVTELLKQIEITKHPAEIILIDDFSNNNFKEINRKNIENTIYIELDENIGRAKIRNLVLKYAKYDFLLFIDCDSQIVTSDIISKYLEIIKQNPSVVCGGSIYDKNKPSRNKLLRWKYGIQKESQTQELRNKFPNKSFMTNNFLIKKQLFEKINFDESITKYGHEDTLFGYSLKKANIPVIHINNPLLNADIDTNVEYLNKTKQGISNLVNILKIVEFDNEFINDISILAFYYKIKPISNIIYIIFKIKKPFIHYLLSKGYVSLTMFNFYKLGLFIEKMRKI